MTLTTTRLDKRGYMIVFKKGVVYKGNGFLVRVQLFPEWKRSRVGYVIRKKLGTAVHRIFLRRLFRSCFVLLEERFSNTYGVIFEPQSEAALLTRKALRKSVFSILQAL